jgi:NADH:ubiquinone oxidoreductase subunit C
MLFLTYLINSIPKHILAIGFRGLLDKKNTNASFLHGLCEISPATSKTLVPLKYILGETQLSFKTLLDLWVVDYPKRFKNLRFQVNYLFLSYDYNIRLREILFTDAYQSVPSITEYYPAANWLEREAWNLFGVFFQDHPDLRTILTDYGFEGKPLRKDFPLVGYTQVRYDDESKRIVIEPVSLTQDFRTFTFSEKSAFK